MPATHCGCRRREPRGSSQRPSVIAYSGAGLRLLMTRWMIFAEPVLPTGRRVCRGRGLGDLMRRYLVLLLAMCAAFGLFAAPATAAPPPANITAFCVVAGGDPCNNERGPGVGTGQDLHVVIGNKCDGPSVCNQFLFFPLGGNFGNVVVDVANQCTNGATCRISVNGFGASFKSFQIRRGLVSGTYNLAR